MLETTQPNISRIMQSINTAYTVYYNLKRKRCGHLFQGRFKSIVVDKDSYLLELTRYIHLNPVRAKIVESPEEFRWSSYNDYLKGTSASLVDTAEAFRYIGMSKSQYKEFVLKGLQVKKSPFENLYAGFILGKAGFVKDTLKAMKGIDKDTEFSYKRIACGIDAELILDKAASYYKISIETIIKAKRRPLLAKQIAVYLLKKYTGLTNEQIGVKFEITYSAVSKIAKEAERLIKENKGVSADIENIISQFKV